MSPTSDIPTGNSKASEHAPFCSLTHTSTPSIYSSDHPLDLAIPEGQRANSTPQSLWLCGRAILPLLMAQTWHCDLQSEFGTRRNSPAHNQCHPFYYRLESLVIIKITFSSRHWSKISIPVSHKEEKEKPAWSIYRSLTWSMAKGFL